MHMLQVDVSILCGANGQVSGMLHSTLSTISSTYCRVLYNAISMKNWQFLQQKNLALDWIIRSLNSSGTISPSTLCLPAVPFHPPITPSFQPYLPTYAFFQQQFRWLFQQRQITSVKLVLRQIFIKQSWPRLQRKYRTTIDSTRNPDKPRTFTPNSLLCPYLDFTAVVAFPWGAMMAL
jgi:hypothetical protein